MDPLLVRVYGKLSRVTWRSPRLPSFPRGPLGAFVGVAALVALLVGLLVPAVQAEEAGSVADELIRTGVYVAPARRSQVDREALVAVVQEASRDGIALGIVIPFDPVPDNKAFALRVRQAADFDAVISIDRDGVFHADTSDDYSGQEVRALSAARSASGTADEVALRFLKELTATPERSAPALVSTIVRAVIYLVLALVLAVIAEHLFRAFRKSRRARTTA